MAESRISSNSPSKSISQCSDGFFELVCEPCNEEGIQAEAGGFCVNCNDYMCNSCIRAHRRNKASKYHIIKDKGHMPQKKPQKTTTVAADTSTEKCDKHPKESIKYFCNDHRILGCTVCITMDHRTCVDVAYISDLTDGLLVCQEYKLFGESVRELTGKSQDFMKRANSNVAKAEECPKKIIKSVHELQQKTLETFNLLKTEMKNQAEVMKSNNLGKLKHISDTVNRILDEIDDLESDIEDLKKTDRFCQLFILMKNTEHRIVSWKSRLGQADSQNHINVYTFVAGSEIEQIIDGHIPLEKLSTGSNLSKNDDDDGNASAYVDSMGTDAHIYAKIPLKVSSQSFVPKANLPIKESAQISESQTSISPARDKLQPVVQLLTEKQNQKVPRDHYTITAEHLYDIHDARMRWCNSYISGLALISGNKLVLTDNLHNQLKLVNLQPIVVISDLLSVPSRPRDITAIGEQAAVTFPQDKTIQIVKVIKKPMPSMKFVDSLVVERDIEVDGACESVEYNSARLFVFFTQPVKIEILSPEGILERRIDINDGINLFIHPQYLAVNPSGDTIYVSDYENNSVTALALDGTVKAQCKDLDSPTGVAVDQYGRILVAEDSYFGSISLLSQDCRKLKVLVDKLRDISSMCYCPETARLFVCIYGRGVSVYQLQSSK